MKTRTFSVALAALAVGALGLAAAGQASAAVTINGAGATFSAPIYQQIGADLRGKGYNLNYQSIGSGAGVSQFIAGTIDFAGSDPFLTSSETAQAAQNGGPVSHFPVAFGAITISYNIPGVKSGLRLDGPTIASIYAGKIGRWNDPIIQRQNKGVKLPRLGITIAHRSDGSGTTKQFTEFLAAWSPAWASGPGVGKDVKWPGGVGGKGNEGVAAIVAQKKGAIGYVELAYARQNKFKLAKVRNRAGNYIYPTLTSTSAAAVGLNVPPSLKIDIIDSHNRTAYPIASQTFMIVHKDLCRGGLSLAKAKAMHYIINYIYGTKGQRTVARLSYAPVPAGLKTKALKQLRGLNCHGQHL